MLTLGTDGAGCSPLVKGDGFGTSVLGFFFGGASGSIEGDADSVGSSFLFFVGLVSALLGVTAADVFGALFFIAARAVEKGLKRFLKAEPISPSRRAASSASCAAMAAASFGASAFFSFFDSDLFNDFGRVGASTLGATFGASVLFGGGGCGLSLSSRSMKAEPLACAAALAL